MTEASLHIRLFGQLELVQGNTSLPAIPSSVSRSLLAYLIVHPGQVFSRDALAGTFWPERPNATARRALSNALWQLRGVLGPAANRLVVEWDTITYNPQAGDWLDVSAFEAAVTRAQRSGRKDEPQEPDPSSLSSAVQLYRADFLEAYYDCWALSERERLRELYLEALERLIGRYKQLGDYEQALIYAQRLAIADPLRETVHREIMRLYFALERPESALRQYETCCQVLQVELGITPEPETRALAAEIARGSQLTPLPHLPQVSKTPPLLTAVQGLNLAMVGRAGERSELLDCVEGLFEAFGGVILVEGEAGIGKTRLMQEIARDLEWRGGQVLWGRGSQVEITPPYGPLVDALGSGFTSLRANQLSRAVDLLWLQLLKPLIPELALQLPGLPPPPPLKPDQEKTRLWEAFVQVIQGWAEFVPLALILEDLHWADNYTLDILPFLARRLQNTRAAIIGTLRGEEARHFPILWDKLQKIDQAGLRGRLALKPLSEHATGELIRVNLGMSQLAPLFEARLYRETEGNPLFVLETLRALYDEELLRYDDTGAWRTPWDESTTDYAELPLPEAVEQVIIRRLSRLTQTHRGVLNLAAVLGSDFDFSWLSASSGLEISTLVEALRELIQRQYLLETPRAYRFSHDKIRQVAYQAMQTEERIRLHQQAGAALEEEHPDHVGLLAHHFAQGQIWNKAVRAYIAQGKEAAAQYMAETALSAFQQARLILDEQKPFTESENQELTFNIWEACYPLYKLQGDYDACQKATACMLELSQSLETVEHRIIAKLQNVDCLHEIFGQDESANQAAQSVVTLAREHQSKHYEAQAWLKIGHIRKQQSQNQSAETALQKALSLYRESGADNQAVTDILLRLGFVYRDLGDIPKAKTVANEALAMSQSQDDRLNQALSHNALAWIARSQGEHQQEAHHCQVMHEQMHTIGYLYYEGVALNNLSLAFSSMGDYEKAIQAGEEALTIFQRLENKRGQTIALLNLSSRYKETGRFDYAQQALQDGLSLAKEMSFADEEARMHLSFSELLTWSRDFAAAHEHIHHASEIAEQLQYPYLAANVAYRSGELYLAMEEFTQALHCFRQAKQAYKEAGWEDFFHLMASFEAFCHLKLGNMQDAIQLSQAAIEKIEGQSLIACFHHYQIMAAIANAKTAAQFLSIAWQQVQECVRVAPDERCRRNIQEKVPVHAAIMAAWRAHSPRQVCLRLPRLDAPTGRPLREDEWVEVTWTVTTPEDDAIVNNVRPDPELRITQRQSFLMHLVGEAEAQGATPTLDDLANVLEVSRATIKRDLAALRQAGYIVKTRGT
jgi:predicted ATPase/DNA-binding SARP family transcriptional activator